MYGGKGRNPPDCRDPPVEDETKISFAWKFAKEVLNENILAQKAGWNANILQKLFYNSSYIIYSDSILFEVSAVAAN